MKHSSQLSGLNSHHARRSRAFTLLEVVIAVGIFAIGMVAVIGLFTPAAKSIGDSADAEAATRVADLLNVKLQTLGFAGVVPLLKVSTGKSHQLTDADAKTNYNPAADPQVFFASRDGTKIGIYADAIWQDPTTKRNSDRDKFFEIALIRNESVSPNDDTLAATMPILAYVARVRWPAFLPLAGVAANVQPNSVQVGANPTATVQFDHSQKQVMFFSGAITR